MSFTTIGTSCGTLTVSTVVPATAPSVALVEEVPADNAVATPVVLMVATPVFAALILRSRIGGMTWAAVAVAMVGLAVLTLGGLSVGYGEALIFVAAMIYALHIVGLGAWSQPGQALGMATVQLIVITVICLVCTAPNGLVLPDRTSDWVSILYMAVFAGAGAMIGQTWAQAHLPPTRAAIIMAMEPVFAALFAVLLGGESATVRMIFGGLLVLAAMLIVELAPRRKVEAEVTHLTV